MRKKTFILLLVLGFLFLLPAKYFFADEAAKTVTVTGYGSNDAEAKKDAYENAISEAIGIYVSSKKMVIEDKLKEEVLTFSAGYIESSKVITREKDESGGVSIKIEAVVKYQVLLSDLETGAFANMGRI